MSTVFDPQAFLDLPMEEPLTRRPLVTAGDYTAIISELGARQWQSKDKYDDAGQLKSGIAYDVTITVDLPEAERTRTGLKGVLTLKDSIMVDMLPGGGGFDTAPGKNTRLRMYREALDMNKAGETFRPRGMISRPFKLRVIHRQIEINGVKTEDWREEIGGLARLA